jgi:hypothetical protein
MDFPLPNPARYRASGNRIWEDDPGINRALIFLAEGFW